MGKCKKYGTDPIASFLLIAVGNGGYAGNGQGYWDGATDEAFFGRLASRETRHVTVIGNGDGGVMDVLRMKTPIRDEQALLKFLEEWRQESPESLERVEAAVRERESFRQDGITSREVLWDALGEEGRSFWRGFIDRRERWQEELKIDWYAKQEQLHAGTAPLLRMLLVGLTEVDPKAFTFHQKARHPGSLPGKGEEVLDRVVRDRPIEVLQEMSLRESPWAEGARVAAFAGERRIINDADFFSRSYLFPHGGSKETAAVAVAPTGRLRGPELLAEYRKKLRERCAQVAVPVLACGPRSGKEPGSLDDSLRLLSVYTALRVAVEDPETKRGKEGAEGMRGMDRPVKDFLAAMEPEPGTPPRWILMGEGGRGKTTLSHFVARALIAEESELLLLPAEVREETKRVRERWSGMLPVVVRIRDLSRIPAGSIRSLMDLIGWVMFRTTYEWSLEGRVRAGADFGRLVAESFRLDVVQALEGGRGLLLILDGMDEIDGKTRPSLARLLSQSAHEQAAGPAMEVVVTARTATVRGGKPDWYKILNWPVLEIQPLSSGGSNGEESQQFCFARQYLAVLGAQSAESEARGLFRAIAARGVGDLAQEPLLLAALARLYLYTQAAEGKPLPDSRVGIVDASVDLLIGEWDDARGIQFSARSLATGMKLGPEVPKSALGILAARSLGVAPATGSRFGFRVEDLRQVLHERLEAVVAEDPEVDAIHLARGLSDRVGILRRMDEGNEPSLEFAVPAYANYLAGMAWASDAGNFAQSVGAAFGDGTGVTEHLRQAVVLGLAGWAEGLDQLRDARRVTGFARVRPQLEQLLALAREAKAQDLRRELFRTFGEALRDLRVDPATLQGEEANAWEGMRAQVRQCIEVTPDFPRTQAAIGMALGWLGDPRPGVGFRREGFDPLGFEWSREIPAGVFTMGSAKGTGFSGERPQHACSLIQRPFVLGRYLVTVAQFQEFTRVGYADAARSLWPVNGWEFRSGRRKPDYALVPEEIRDDYRRHVEREPFPLHGPRTFGTPFDAPNGPIVGVSWYEAVAYCNWLNREFTVQQLGLPEGWEVRLPTEAEWERAASYRKGTKRPYRWGTAPDVAQRVNCRETQIEGTSAVGLFGERGQAECLAEDLIGNVWEWCLTGWTRDYEGYAQQPWVRDALSTAKGQGKRLLEEDRLRVVRGGAWYNSPDLCRAAFRYRALPEDRSDFLGFRLAASPISGLWSI